MPTKDSKEGQQENNVYVYPEITERKLFETSKWKTFKNISGWSIKYPPEWHVSGCCYKTVQELGDDPDAFVGFYPPPESDEGWLMVTNISDKPENIELWDWFENISSSGPPSVKNERVVFNGTQAFKKIWRSCSNICNLSPQSEYYGSWHEDVYVVYDNTEAFELGFNTNNVYKNIIDYKNYEIYQQMLSTFQFDRKF
jgi:hypothetical protein